MFGSLGAGEILLLLLVGLILFGPERLPTIARDAAKVLRQLRDMATAARDEVTAELGPELGELDVRALHPRTFVAKHLFGDDDEPRTLPASEPSDASTASFAGRADDDGVSLTKPGVAAVTPFDADAT